MQKNINSLYRDRMTYDSAASNKVKDCVIMLGIFYEKFDNKLECDSNDDFVTVYKKITKGKEHFVNKYRYFNKGIEHIRSRAAEKGFTNKKMFSSFSKTRLRRFCETGRARLVRIPLEADAFLDILLEEIFKFPDMKTVMTKYILCDCRESEHMPRNCNRSITGYCYIALKNIVDMIPGTKRAKMAEKMILNLNEVIATKNISNCCK